MNRWKADSEWIIKATGTKQMEKGLVQTTNLLITDTNVLPLHHFPAPYKNTTYNIFINASRIKKMWELEFQQPKNIRWKNLVTKKLKSLECFTSPRKIKRSACGGTIPEKLLCGSSSGSLMNIKWPLPYHVNIILAAGVSGIGGENRVCAYKWINERCDFELVGK